MRGARPKALLVSVALPEHRPNVLKIAERVAALPAPIRPKIIVGGYAVKLGLVAEIPGAELMADISELTRVLGMKFNSPRALYPISTDARV